MNNIFLEQYNLKPVLMFLINIFLIQQGLNLQIIYLFISLSLGFNSILNNFHRTLSLDSRSVKISWGLLNDSYLHSQTLSYDPFVLCCACIYIALECKEKSTISTTTSTTNEQKKEIPEQWWTLFDINNEIFWQCVNYLIDIQILTSNYINEINDETMKINSSSCNNL